MARSYNKKIIVSGDIYEVYEYENSIIEGYTDTKKSSKGRQSVANEECKIENREKVLNRARTDLRRIINSNIGMYGQTDKFMTLTFAENMTDLKSANYEFKKFMQRLKRFHKIDMKYAAVPEIQQERYEKTGFAVWHFHVIFFNLPYTRANKLSSIWGNGFIKINRIDHVDNVGAYICKYMTKDNGELKGQKCYFTSRNLIKPQEIKDKQRVEALACSLPPDTVTYENVFENEYNKVSYKQYSLKTAKMEDVI